MHQTVKLQAWKLLIAAGNMILFLLLVITTYLTAQLMTLMEKVADVRERLLIIENSACTTVHCSGVTQSLGDIKTKLEWVKDTFQRNEKQIEKNTTRIDAVERSTVKRD